MNQEAGVLQEKISLLKNKQATHYKRWRGEFEQPLEFRMSL